MIVIAKPAAEYALESGDKTGEEKSLPVADHGQLDGMASLFASSLKDKLLSLDVVTMTPLEAMNELYKLQEEAKREAGQS